MDQNITDYKCVSQNLVFHMIISCLNILKCARFWLRRVKEVIVQMYFYIINAVRKVKGNLGTASETCKNNLCNSYSFGFVWDIHYFVRTLLVPTIVQFSWSTQTIISFGELGWDVGIKKLSISPKVLEKYLKAHWFLLVGPI